MHECPKCRTASLRELAALGPHVGGGALPRCCNQCGGFWLKRDVVVPLHESGVLKELDASEITHKELDRKNGLCPEGHGILSRTKVAWDDPFYLERCSKCGGMWLDAGEWRRLTEEDLIEHLDDLFEPAWRRRLQREEGQVNLRETLTERLGDDLVGQLETLAASLATHRDASLALAFLRQTVRTHRRRHVRDSVDSYSKQLADDASNDER
jgi:Zn-finger nucleic acid-binding protein